jgi:AraC-like DNA-binding protein
MRMGKIQQNLREIQQVGKRTREFLVHPEHCPALRKHQIILAGISLTTPKFRFVRLQPVELQIMVGLRGSGRVLVNHRWQACPAGKAYCTPPGQINAYNGADGWEVGWVIYKPSASLVLREPMLLEVDPRPLEYVLYGLHHEITTRRDPALLEHWTELLHAQASRIVESQHPARLWRLWQKVQADLAYAWTLPELADRAGIGPEYLRQLCRRELGTSPMRQVARLRMQQAISLLSEGYKVSAIANAVGYDNAYAFSTSFKRITGRPPSHFRPA